MRRLLGLWFLLSLTLLTALPAGAAYDSAQQASSGPLTLSRMTPEGEGVTTLREVVFTFDRDVVPVGRMERSTDEIPIRFTPALNCEWRWLSRNALGCRLDEANQLKEASTYQVVIEPGIVTEEGVGMAQAETRVISTARPTLHRVQFKHWRGPDVPVLRLSFNQPVARSSVAASISLNPDTPYTISVDESLQELPVMLALPGEKDLQLKVNQAPRKSDDQTQTTAQEEYRRNWLIEPSQGLGLDRDISVDIKPGLKSALGPLAGNEKRTAMTFTTFPSFKFLGVRCHSSKTPPGAQEDLMILPPGMPIDQQGLCDPLKRAGLVFTTPVTVDDIKKYVSITPDLAGDRKDYDPWANAPRYGSLGQPHRRDRDYTVWFPEYLKAFQAYQIAIDHKQLRDEFGTYLPASALLDFKTDHRAPQYHLPHSQAVLEAGVDSEQPVVVTNLEKLTFNYDRITATESDMGLTKTVTIPQADDVAFPVRMGIRDMVAGGSGVVVGKFETTPTVTHGSWCDRCFLTQVSPWQVHAKIGHFNSTVWVVEFATGKLVSDAKVELFLSSEAALAKPQSSVLSGKTDADGLATLGGTQTFDPQLDKDSHPLSWYIKVTKGKDIALLPLTSYYRVQGYYGDYYWGEDRAATGPRYPQQQPIYHHIHSWGTTAQGVYRLGDTIQYKIYVRDQDNYQFVAAPSQRYTLKIVDPKGKTVETRKDITLSAFGAFDGEFAVAKSAAVGWYQFQLQADFAPKTEWRPLKVLVADFTPAPFRVTNDLNADLFKPGDELRVSSQARLHAGGPYVNAKTRLNISLQAGPVTVAEDALKRFEFDSTRAHRSTLTLHESEDQLDAKGDHSKSVTLADTAIVVGKLRVETAVRDDRGKNIAAMATARYVGRDRFVGLKMPGWYLEANKPAKIQWAVVDEFGKFATNSPVEIAVEFKEVKTARVKGAGNAYLSQYQENWIAAAGCKGNSGVEPSICEFTPQAPGEYRVRATVTDTQKRTHTTQLDTWASGKGYVLWDQPSSDTLQVIPQQERYKVGDTARFLVKNPYPDAKALITVERYGVMRSYVQTWESNTPIVEIPITADDVPGFYLSMVAMSPRVDKPLGDNDVDLGKPAYKIAYKQIDVIDPVKQLKIDITSDKPTYKPRENAKLEITVKNHQGETPSEPQEIAIAVLDEAVFDLLQGGKKHFDPYSGFYHLDGRDLENYNLLTRLIGRQNFPKKGATPAGDGGKSMDMRALFKFVSYWNPGIKTDAKGQASVTFSLPDNLTGWRVLALAVTPTDEMGLGEHSFAVNKPVELRPAMPNQVIEGDQFQAGFTVMNRTREPRTLHIDIEATGAVAQPVKQSFTVEAKPFERVPLWLPIKTQGSGEVNLTAKASDGENDDALLHKVPVNKYRSLITAANYGTTEANKIEEPLQIPTGIHGDVGAMSMVLSPSVIANVDGAFEYMRDYPYDCWEQQLTRAVLASQYVSLKAYVSPELLWPSAASLPQQVLKAAASYQAPNGGMVFWLADDRYVSPYLSAYTQLAFNWLRRAGHTVPEDVEKKLQAYLRKMLSQDVFPDFYNPGMSSSVRAVALAALAEADASSISLVDLERFRSAVPQMDLFGKAHYLQAATRVNGADAIIGEVTQMLLGQATQSGGKFQFNERWDDSYRHTLATPLRSNCAVLETLVALGEKSAWAPKVGDIPFKLVRAITQSRGARTHFENTQESVFCMNSLVSYSRIYEATPPSMKVDVQLDGKSIGEAAFTKLSDPSNTLSQALTPADVGQRRTFTLNKQGEGRLYYSSRLQYAPLAVNAETINAGIEVTREYSVERNGEWILLNPSSASNKGTPIQSSPMQIKRGELVRVDLYISMATARNYVVVNDPVPGGLEPVNRDLATASTVDADKGEFKAAGGSWFFHFSDWSYYGTSFWNFYHKELRHDSARFYADYLPAGNYHLSYTAQAIAEGQFRLQPTHSEEMYDPDVFGKSKPAELTVVAGD